MIPYRLVKIGNFYLTANGLVGGDRYILAVEGLDELEAANRGAIDRAANGFPYKFLIENDGAGVEIRLVMNGLREADLTTIRGIINTAENAGNSVVVEITDGPTPDISLNCLFGTESDPKPIAYSANILNGQLRDVTISFTVQAINTP